MNITAAQKKHSLFLVRFIPMAIIKISTRVYQGVITKAATILLFNCPLGYLVSGSSMA